MVFLALEFLKPVGDFLGEVAKILKIPFEVGLGFFAQVYDAFPPTHVIGAYGLAIITVTILIKFLLFPLFQTQLKLTKKTQSEQKRIQPELAELRKKYKKDPQKLNQEMMALYKEHNINPLSSLAGCLPTLAQLPVLIGLYQAIIDHSFFESLHVSPFFMGLNLAIPASLSNPVTWILPVLAGLTTFVQTRMMAQPKADTDDPQAAQMQQVTQSMSFMMPLLITFFAFQQYALQGMVLYWIVSNLFSIGQQYTVNGWGQLPILGNQPKGDEPDAGRRNLRDGRRGATDAAGRNGKNGKAPGGADVVAKRTPTQAEVDEAEAAAAARVRRRKKQASGRRGRR
ncbi:MAG: YidC/Oxa1 family membrane protein insertase [Candidatus Dormibacteraeota bacterium]|nr:YidC/Oxa1 family membrane protein insertase [Candidatus Dormibacteraeota bacterium]